MSVIQDMLAAAHNKTNTLKIISYVGKNRTRFKELMVIFLRGEYRLTQRAAWPLSYIAENNTGFLSPYYSSLVEALADEKRHPACARNILRILQTAEIPDEIASPVFDYCVTAIRDENKPVAIRAFSITVASRLAARYPELKNELREHLHAASVQAQTPAVKHRLKTAFKAL
jgi:hypothetical protein